MTDLKNKFHELGYYSEKCDDGYIITFDPGAHVSQDVKVFLTESEYQILQDTPTSKKFSEIVRPAMRKQNVKVI